MLKWDRQVPEMNLGEFVRDVFTFFSCGSDLFMPVGSSLRSI